MPTPPWSCSPLGPGGSKTKDCGKQSIGEFLPHSVNLPQEPGRSQFKPDREPVIGLTPLNSSACFLQVHPPHQATLPVHEQEGGRVESKEVGGGKIVRKQGGWTAAATFPFALCPSRFPVPSCPRALPHPLRGQKGQYQCGLSIGSSPPSV